MWYLQSIRLPDLKAGDFDYLDIELVGIRMFLNAEENSVVEVFDLKGHPSAFRVYAWAHDTDDPANPRRHVTVLHAHPIKSAQDAVRAAIIQEFRNLGTAEES